MLDDNTKIDIFFQFLKDNNAYDEYIESFRTNKVRESLLYVTDRYYLNIYFTWADTKSGFRFWQNIVEKWILQKDNLYKQYKRNELIEKILC